MIARGICSPTSVWISGRTWKRGRTYSIRWIDPDTGKGVQESCGRDKAYARQRRDNKRLELRGKLGRTLRQKMLGALRDAVPTFYTGKSTATIRKVQESLGTLLRLCGDRRLERVDRGFIMEFRARRASQGVAAATLNIDLRHIKSALSYAVDAGWIPTNPLWRWKGMQVREPEKTIRIIEADEFERLLEVCEDPALRALLIVGYYQGLRRAELAHLRWNAIDLERGVMHVRNVVEANELTKSRRNRTLPLREATRRELIALLRYVPKIVSGNVQRPKYDHCFTWPDGKAFKVDWLTHEFARLVKRADLSYATLHDLRRSFSTLAQRGGVDKHTVKDLGGWSTVGVVERHYTGEVPERLKDAMALLDGEDARGALRAREQDGQRKVS